MEVEEKGKEERKWYKEAEDSAVLFDDFERNTLSPTSVTTVLGGPVWPMNGSVRSSKGRCRDLDEGE